MKRRDLFGRKCKNYVTGEYLVEEGLLKIARESMIVHGAGLGARCSVS